jgi:hypothetical protein
LNTLKAANLHHAAEKSTAIIVYGSKMQTQIFCKPIATDYMHEGTRMVYSLRRRALNKYATSNRSILFA